MTRAAHWKSYLINTIKILTTAALIYWLVTSGRLDFGQLRILIEHPGFLIGTILVFLIGPTLIGSFRWYLLLHGLGYRTPWFQVLKLHLIGMFFNAAMPGAVGGDLIKVGYIIRSDRSLGRMPAMMSVLIDRIMGLFGLFGIGAIVILWSYQTVFANPVLKHLSVFVLLAAGASLVLFAAIMLTRNEDKDPIVKLLSFNLPGFKLLRNVYGACRRYHDRLSYLFGSWFCSIVLQLMMFGYFLLIAQLISGDSVSATSLAVIFPIGIFVTAIPLAPGGIGVGHMAFESLFSAVGMQGGANVFNLYVLCSLALSLIGAIPFLLNKKQFVVELGNDHEALSHHSSL